MEFTKMHGIGNDFVVVNCLERMPDFDPASMARRICDRHFGVGADGLMLVMPSNEAAYTMRLWNSDGSVAEMCGNGIRCFAKYVYDRGLTDGSGFTIETLDGVKKVSLDCAGGKAVSVTIGMGRPVIQSNNLDEVLSRRSFTGEELVEQIQVGGKSYRMVYMNMGVPHTVVYAEDLAKVPFKALGPALEAHPRFPRKTNVNFVQVMNRNQIRDRVWERGAGETLACGTGACASAVASCLLGLTERTVQVTLPGGTLRINVNDDGYVYMTGPATEVYTGHMEA